MVLSKDSGANIRKGEIFKVYVSSDNGGKHLPFLRESGEGNHRLELVRNFYLGSVHVPIGSKDFVKVDGRVVVNAYVCAKALLKVSKDCRGRCSAIASIEFLPDLVRGSNLL